MKTEIMKQGKKAIEKAIIVLEKKGTIIFPTETSYGIGADALDKKAVAKVHEAKQQSQSKPISVIVSDLEQAEKIAELNAEARILAKKFFPEPLTLIAKQKSTVPKNLSRKKIALRIPSNKFARELCKKFGKPITATSANIHEEPAIYSGKKAIEKFFGKVDLIIDAGRLPKRKASAIYDTIGHKIIREGKISEKQIKKELERRKKCREK